MAEPCKAVYLDGLGCNRSSGLNVKWCLFRTEMEPNFVLWDYFHISCCLKNPILQPRTVLSLLSGKGSVEEPNRLGQW
jgi:hypothetical protein